MKKRKRQSRNSENGFSIIELAIVVTIALIVAGFAIPNALTATRTAKFRGAVASFSGLLQTARINAIRDNRYYSTYFLNGGTPQGYVDMLPQGTTGASGNGGTLVAAGDPVMVLPSEVTTEAAAGAPATANLKTQLLASATGVSPTDGATSPITFGPRGLPCKAVALSGGSVCNNLGGPVAYWLFFQDNLTNGWEAITVTPAGRIQEWYYTGAGWSEL